MGEYEAERDDGRGLGGGGMSDGEWADGERRSTGVVGAELSGSSESKCTSACSVTVYGPWVVDSSRSLSRTALLVVDSLSKPALLVAVVEVSSSISLTLLLPSSSSSWILKGLIASKSSTSA